MIRNEGLLKMVPELRMDGRTRSRLRMDHTIDNLMKGTCVKWRMKRKMKDRER